MELKGKTFNINNANQEVVKTDNDFAYFSSGARIKKSLLVTKYEEVMDPNSFFSSSSGVDAVANSIKNFDEKAMTENASQPTTQPEISNVNVAKIDNTQGEVTQVNNTVQQPKHLDFFSKIKRNTEIEIDFSIKEKFPDLEFVKMMNDNYETSIIDHFAVEIVEKLIYDPEALLESVKKKIHFLVYGEELIDEETPIAEEVIEEVIEEEITEGNDTKEKEESADETIIDDGESTESK